MSELILFQQGFWCEVTGDLVDEFHKGFFLLLMDCLSLSCSLHGYVLFKVCLFALLRFILFSFCVSVHVNCCVVVCFKALPW
jgi:hypothetical protein